MNAPHLTAYGQATQGAVAKSALPEMSGIG